MLSDAQLLRAYTRDRSQDAFEELVRRHLSLVYRSALRQLNSDTHRAEDVAQMVFLALARQAHQLTGHPNLSAWLYTTTHRITCEVIRTEMRRRRREQAWTEAAQPAESPSIWPQIAPLLDEAIRTLSTREREAVLLRYFGNRSFAEIGEALAMTEDAARMRVNRSLEKLRDRLSARGVAVTSTALAGALDADVALGAPGTLVKSIATAAAHATPAGAVAGLILSTSMAASKLATMAAVLAATVAVGLSIQQWATLRAATVELEYARGAADLLRQQISVERTAPKNLTLEPNRSHTTTPVNAMDVYFEAERAKGDAFLAAHPEVRAMLTIAQRARLRGRFFSLYRDLKLSEEQIAEFEALMLTQGGKVWPNVGSLWLGERLDPGQCDARLRAALGEETFARLKTAYLAGGETVAQKLAARLAWSDEPLPPSVGSAVRDVIDDTYVPGKGVDWDRALAELQPVLNDRQFAALRDLYAIERFQCEQAAAAKSR